jgi:hypothetical protein
MTEAFSGRIRRSLNEPPLRAALFLLVVILLEFAAILYLNQGFFSYSLDDPYIHLRMAGNIAGGTYGINAGEPSSPSSSILWPFILAGFALIRIEMFAPLILNTLAALGSLFAIWEIQRQALGEPEDAAGRWKHTLLLVALALAINMVGLIYTGMEHSLQLLCTLLLVAGLIHEQKTGRVSWWLIAGIILGPLIRYENLFLSLPALLYLMERGHFRKAIVLGIALAVPIAGFSLFLYSQGLGFLPASVLAKASPLSAGSLGEFFSLFLQNFLRRESALLSMGVLLLFLPAFSGRREDSEAVFCSTLGIAGALHILGGSYGWYARYEIYIWAAVILGLLYHFRATIGQWLRSVTPVSVAIVMTVALVFATPSYLLVILTTPRSAQDIYLQQYQMHRLAVDYVQGPVGVNDLGWVSYRNPNYVLDLVSLSNPEYARKYYRAMPAEWLEAQVKAKGIQLVMIYDDWFPQRPSNWILLGRLHLLVPRIIVAGDTVSFYATDSAFVPSLRATLERFQPTLPDGAVLELEP